MRDALEQIAALGGNLSDDRLTARTGANDAVSRGLMYCEARRLARAALAAPEPGDAEAKLAKIREATAVLRYWVDDFDNGARFDNSRYIAGFRKLLAAIAAPDMGGSAPLDGEGEKL